ncbi:NUDIX domain-containing protein [Streptomyces sp. NPDC046203]|uniref:NUDIX domain-containing protein n=1 Tax=Streptomyces sp. NPDC046203 TaxID=3154602 RepID=UPI0033DEF663
MPEGTTEAGERPWETAMRETEEETGLVASGLRAYWRPSSGRPERPGRRRPPDSSSTAGA